MVLKERLEYDLSSLTETVSSIREVVAIILFGSVARGDYDEYSDYDLLVVFRDREGMWRRWDKLFQNVGRLGLLVHLIPKSMDEFAESEPTFLREVLKHGVVLYSKYPFQSFLSPLRLERMVLAAYSMRRLGQKDKMRLVYRLYGRKGSNGLVKRLGGLKIAEGCILIPEDASDALLKALTEYGVEVKTFNVYVQQKD
jgi:predicted nucleotidyltransferase